MTYSGYFRKLLAVVALSCLPVVAPADPWFIHEFGELRSYHGDFLNVCSDGGTGECRSVQYILERDTDPFFGTERLAIHRRPNGDYALEFWARRLPDRPKGPFAIVIDDMAFEIPAAAWQEITPEGYNVSETISISDPAVTSPIVAAMRRGFFMRFTHDVGETVYSLRGLISALNAIEIQKRSGRHDS